MKKYILFQKKNRSLRSLFFYFTKKNKILKFICLISIAIAFFAIIDIIDTAPYLSMNNKVLARIVEIPPMPTPAEIDAGIIWDRFIGFLKGIAPIIFGLMISVAAIIFIFGAGNPEAIRTAWKIIIFSLIGLLIILGADTIVGWFR